MDEEELRLDHEELRLECLRLAISAVHNDRWAILDTARTFFQFVTTDSKPAPTKEATGR